MRTLTQSQLSQAVNEISANGWVVIEDIIELDLIEEIHDQLDHLEKELDVQNGENLFEGTRTSRIYNLLAHGETFEKMPVHQNVLPVVEGVLGQGLTISSLSSIAIGPDEKAQPIHSDDQLIPIPKPHPPIICNTMWAITDFTDQNGATRLVPGTHTKDHSPNPLGSYETIPAEMTRGSVLFWVGSLWHGGGANLTSERRVGVALNYCAGYIRQQENQLMGVPFERLAQFSHRLKELAGLGIYNGLLGHIDKRHPCEFLFHDGSEAGLIWDYAKVPPEDAKT